MKPFIGIVLLLLAGLPFQPRAQQTLVVTNDSSHSTGRLVSDSADVVILDIPGRGVLRFPRLSVSSVQTLADTPLPAGDSPKPFLPRLDTLPQKNMTFDEVELRSG